MKMETYFGNSYGLVLGPYSDNEIQPQIRAQSKLSASGGDVFRFKARSYQDAQHRLGVAIRKSERE